MILECSDRPLEQKHRVNPIYSLLWMTLTIIQIHFILFVSNAFYVFFLRFYVLFMRDTQRERQRPRQREKQAPRRELNVRLDPGHQDHDLSRRQMLNR